MSERALIVAAFIALVSCVILACGIGWTYAMPGPAVDRPDFGVLR